MLAHRFKAHVKPDQPLVLSLPKDLPEGDVEVILLFNTLPDTNNLPRSLREFNHWLQHQPGSQRHWEDINQCIEAALHSG